MKAQTPIMFTSRGEGAASESHTVSTSSRPPFQYDDGGRSQSQRPNQKRDCVVRSIAIATQGDYDLIYDILADKGRKCGRSTAKNIWQTHCNEHPTLHRHSFPATRGVPRMSLFSFVNSFTKGSFIVQMAGHLCAVIDGVIHDDSTPDRDHCVYAAWEYTE